MVRHSSQDFRTRLAHLCGFAQPYGAAVRIIALLRYADSSDYAENSKWPPRKRATQTLDTSAS